MKNYEYLDLLPRKLDPSQKNVCCTEKNTIVAAGAGSGKTQVLATRFAWLVMSCNIRAPKILTLTFTKKAAAEMYSRIYETLTFFATNENTPTLEKQRAQEALKEFADVHIQTLDSYCTSIVRQAANRYGIKPDFGQDSIDEINLSEKALSFVLTHRNNPAILHFADVGKFQDLADKYFVAAVGIYSSIANDADYFCKNLEVQKKIIFEEWNKAQSFYGKIYRDTKSFIDAAENEAGDPYFVQLDKLINEQPDFALITNINQISSKDSQLLAKLEENINWVETIIAAGKATRKKSDIYTNTKAYFAELNFDEFASMADFIFEYEYLFELYTLFDKFAEEINSIKRISGQLSFKDISDMSLKILNEQEDIRLQEQNAFEKIMIDEFQDNNKKNRDLLFLLSQKPGTEELRDDKLFFVGDEKQSIYRFRNADVRVFNNLKTDLEVEPLQMVYNYRSKPELISTFNQLFGGFSPSGANPEKYAAIFQNESKNDFEATFPKAAIAKKVDTKNYSELPPAVLNNSSVRCHVTMFNETLLNQNEEEYIPKTDQLYFYIAKKIKEMYDNLEGKDKKYSSFAILDKSRTHRAVIQKWLSHFGIPYTVDQQEKIFENAPVNDIYNFLRLCVFPQDNKAYAEVLASPFVGLSEAATELVLCKSESAFETSDELKNALGTEAEKFELGCAFYQDNLPKILSQPLTDTLNFLWIECGYRYETLMDAKVYLQAEQFDLLFEFFRRCDENGEGISALIDKLESIRSAGKSFFKEDVADSSEVAYPLERNDAVTIMTIHKSKGLQFKHVFICGCTGNPKEDNDSCAYSDDETGLAVRPVGNRKNYFFLKNENLFDEMALAEFKRLIYVAVTRAEESAFITGVWEERKATSKAKITPMEEIILSYYPAAQNADMNETDKYFFEPDSPFSFLSIKPVTKNEAYGGNSSEIKADISKIEGLIKTSPSIKTEIPENNRKTPSSLEQDAQKNTDSSYEKYDSPYDIMTTSKFTAGDFGTLVHEFLRFQAEGIDAESYTPPEKLFKDLSPEKRAENIRICREMCKNFKDSSFGKAAYGENSARSNGRFIKAEWAFRMYWENNIWTGSIDLIYENDDGTYSIVDYKSDKQLDPEFYRGQQELYRIAASKMLKTDIKNIHCYLFGLRENKEVQLI